MIAPQTRIGVQKALIGILARQFQRNSRVLGGIQMSYRGDHNQFSAGHDAIGVVYLV